MPPSAALPPETEDPATLVLVDRAIADLRRGQFIGVTGPGNADDSPEDSPGGSRGRTAGESWSGRKAYLVQAAEFASAQSLDKIQLETGRAAFLVLTPPRALSLGLGDDRRIAGGAGVAIALPRGADPVQLRALADPLSIDPLSRPPGGAASGAARLVARGSAAHAALALTKLARLLPAAIVAEIQPLEDGTVFPKKIGAVDLTVIEGEAAFRYEEESARHLRYVAEARVPLEDAEDTRILAFRPSDGGTEHLAIVIGRPDPDTPVLIRLHSECLTGDLLGSLRCDCGPQLRGAIREIAERGSGIVLYLAQEGRGIGLVNKLRAYTLQDGGLDTFDANERLGYDADERAYVVASEMLKLMGVKRVRVMTNNPDKIRHLEASGVIVAERVPHVFPSNPHNERYLFSKSDKGGHLF